MRSFLEYQKNMIRIMNRATRGMRLHVKSRDGDSITGPRQVGPTQPHRYGNGKVDGF